MTKPSDSQGQPSPGQPEEPVPGPPAANAGAGNNDGTPPGGLSVGYGATLGATTALGGQPVSAFPPAQAWGLSEWRPSNPPPEEAKPAAAHGQPSPPPLAGAAGPAPAWGTAGAPGTAGTPGTASAAAPVGAAAMAGTAGTTGTGWGTAAAGPAGGNGGPSGGYGGHSGGNGGPSGGNGGPAWGAAGNGGMGWGTSSTGTGPAAAGAGTGAGTGAGGTGGHGGTAWGGTGHGGPVWGGGAGAGGDAGGNGTGAAPGGDNLPAGPAEPAVVVSPRWEKKKRRPFWMRSRLLIFMAALWGVLFWYALSADPLLSVHDGLVQTWNGKWWLAALFALELVRQIHYLISEHWGLWNHFWADNVFGRLSRRTLRFSDWARYRAKRIVFVVLLIAAVAVIAGAALDESPITALFSLPGKLVSVLGYLAYVVFILVIAVGQFAAIFWFLSKGGVDVYFPDDVKTRFSHVWGQDAVLARVKESIVFLEDPDSIEARGGYVPGGILLWGPPGTGKTLMAEAVAGETGKPFVFVDPGAFIQMFMGVGVLKVKSLFRKLRKLAMRYGGVIVFFDEADSLGSRGSLTPGGVFGPGGVQGMEPWPWTSGDCHGGSYLSDSSLGALLANWSENRPTAGSSGPEGRRGVRDRGMVMGGMGGGGGGMGTLQALLSEMSGLSKPRGFMNRVVRRALGFKPKPPPKYRILIMMATNMPNTLDDALLRPGRIDRIYKVGYPSKAGRVRTYHGYFDKVSHELTGADIDKLATITPYATGATIKDLVNESLIVALRRDHPAITWADVLEAKRLKDLGPPEDVEYVERERHAVAIHEACHAVVAYRVRKHLEIDLATIEKGGTYLGMVSSIKPEDRFTSWRSEYEADVMVSLASLAGERKFFAGDSSSGVSGDLESATMIASLMEGYWGMGETIASQGARRSGSGWPPGQGEGDMMRGDTGKKVEERLHELLARSGDLLETNKAEVFGVAHALESHKTLSGEDVEAVIEGKKGRGIDGRPYKTKAFMEVYGDYHERLVNAHVNRVKMAAPLPKPEDWAPELFEVPALVSGNGWGPGPGQLEGGGAFPEASGGGWGLPSV